MYMFKKNHSMFLRENEAEGQMFTKTELGKLSSVASEAVEDAISYTSRRANIEGYASVELKPSDFYNDFYRIGLEIELDLPGRVDYKTAKQLFGDGSKVAERVVKRLGYEADYVNPGIYRSGNVFVKVELPLTYSEDSFDEACYAVQELAGAITKEYIKYYLEVKK